MKMKKQNSEQSKKRLKTNTELLEISKNQSKYSSNEKIHLWNAPSAVDYVCKELEITLDKWQYDYINAEGDTAVRAGRQSGKSFAQSIRNAIFCLKYKPKSKEDTVLITSGVERQAYELYLKIRRIIETIAPKCIKGRPTMEKLELTNGLRILALPCGRDGAGLRSYTVVRLVVDEAHYVPDEVYTAIEPMLATTGGSMDLLSTPRGNKGKFYDAFQEDSGFTTFHTTSEECPRIPKDFLERKKKSMTKSAYAQEFLAEFQGDLQQFFPRELIDKCINIEWTTEKGNFFLGIDVARYGGDENAYVEIQMESKTKLELKNFETTERVGANETIKKIIQKNRLTNYKKILIDDGGIGGPVLDVCLQEPSIKRKIIGINNASRAIDAKAGRGKKILKENLYGNLKRLMEQGFLKLPNNPQLIESLLSIQFEIDETTGNTKIFGRYSHITEGLTRAVWPSLSKGLNIWLY